MKCLICGRVNLSGATLCLDCKAARKRAFDATVTQPLLAAAGAARGRAAAPPLLKSSQSVPDAGRRAAKMALAQGQLNTVVETPPSRTARWPIAVAALCILLAAVGYFGPWSKSGKPATPATVPAEPSAAESTAAPLAVRAAAPGSSAPPASAAAALPVGINASRLEPAPATKRIDAAKKANPRTKVEKVPTPAPAPEPPPPPAVVVAPPPPAIVREPPRIDPWQPMNDAMARCPANDISGRLACEQRVRARYCEGHWGQVPQCASIPYVDHGQ